jgi:hypothetical protein
MSKTIDLRKIGTGTRNTSMVDAILCDKYPELVKNGRFDYDYIPVTNNVVELMKAISKLQDLYYDIDPNNQQVQFVIDKIIELYEPLVQRARARKNKIKEQEKRNQLFLEEKATPHLKQISKALESCLKQLEKIDVLLISNNLALCDERLIPFENTAERLIASSNQLKNKVDSMINR